MPNQATIMFAYYHSSHLYSWVESSNVDKLSDGRTIMSRTAWIRTHALLIGRPTSYQLCRTGGGGGGGGTSICMHIGYVPRKRPPFSALNFCSGAYHFHKLPKNPFWSITILHFLADFAVPETIIFKISLISSPPTAGSARTQSNCPERLPDASWQFRRLAFSRSKQIKLVPEPRIFKLKTAQARSRAPHFHA